MKKITFWSSIATIVGVIYTFTTSANNTTQNIHGDNNTVIGETHAPLTINYNSGEKSNNSSSQHALKNATTIYSEPGIEFVMDESKYVCEDVVSGTKVKVTGNTIKKDHMLYREIEVLSGDCIGKTGWVSNEVVEYK
jgi:hypothetical protein